jgi:UDP-N-acetylglucosamine--N-acetylmuramyl-(pentapeptide) pyrophosphoryl-undecaprenol N-acetylglucosamine transferase
VDRAYLSFEETASLFPKRAARVFGNPVRRSFVGVGHMARVDPLGFEMRARRVLVIGGSQGAKVLNERVPEALARAGLAERGIEIVHQAGHAMCDSVRARYEQLGLNATVTPFIDDMARAYASAALVIGRAGATSLAEICAVGRPSLLIPFPHAADDHQWHNARALEARGAAVALREESLTVETLAAEVSTLLADPERRRAMAEAARGLGHPDAAASIVDDLCEWLGCASNDELGSDPEGHSPTDQASSSTSEPDSQAHAEASEGSFPPDAEQRRAMARKRTRRRSLAWSHTDLYYGQRAIAALE